MDLPPLKALAAFEAAARLTSLTLAGNERNVTQAAVGGQIRRLEAWLGRRLFQRSGRGIALTSAGLQFQQAIAGALATIESAGAVLRHKPDRRSINVGCIPSIATRWLVPNLPLFTERCPNINVRIFYAQAQERFSTEDHDVLITYGEDHSAGLVANKLFSRTSKPVASPAYCASRRDLGTAEALLSADLLHDETMGAWADWFGSVGLSPKTPLRGTVFQDFNLLATAVIAGHGVALCPVEVCRHEIGRGDLVVLSESSTLQDTNYNFICSTDPTHVVRSFRQWFQISAINRG